jgi:hypothetical protein
MGGVGATWYCALHALHADAYYAEKFLSCSDRYIEVNKADFELYVGHELESESREEGAQQQGRVEQSE